MRYFNEDKTKELREEDIDFTKGNTIQDTLIIHHDEQPEIKEIPEEGHYEVIHEYPNGGKDVKWVIDKLGVKGSPKIEAYDEKETIYVYKPYSEEYIRERDISQQITNLQYELSQTDYKLLKYLEGYYTDEEYAPIKKERQEMRDKINNLKSKLK